MGWGGGDGRAESSYKEARGEPPDCGLPRRNYDSGNYGGLST